MPFASDRGVRAFIDGFADDAVVASFVEGPPRFTPGLDALHRMAGILLAETAPADARVLVLGAGGGLEIAALARSYPQWHFVGVDPAPKMLGLAEQTIGPLMDRVTLVEGMIDAAPSGPFDAATCLLTLHFLDHAERVRTIAAMRDRLAEGATLVAAHGSFPQGNERATWIARYAEFALQSGADPNQVSMAREALTASSATFSPEEDAAIFTEAGFRDVSEFYAAFTWRGWVMHR